VRPLLQLLIVVSLVASIGNSQTAKQPQASEQSRFAVEGIPIEKPKDVPESVLKILRKDDYVVGCLRQGQSVSEIPTSWFVGSEIHLDGSDQIDLIVVPRQLAPKKDEPTDNACLYGANVAPFWVFRQTSGQPTLVLEISAAGLKVLNAKTNGCRHIRTWSSTALTRTISYFRFDGHQYRPVETKAK
jgi:hypothetical protein